MYTLAALIERNFSARGVKIHDAATWFHRGGGQTIVDDVDRYNMVGFFENCVRRFFVAVFQNAKQVSCQVCVNDLRTVAECVRNAYRGVDLVDVEFD